MAGDQSPFFTSKGLSLGLRRDQDDRALNIDDISSSLTRAYEIKQWAQSEIDKKLPESFFSSGSISEADIMKEFNLHKRVSIMMPPSRHERAQARLSGCPPIGLSPVEKTALVGVFDGFGGAYVASWLSKNLEYGVAKYLSLGYSHGEELLRCVYRHADRIISSLKEAKYFGSTCTLVMGFASEETVRKHKFVVAHLGECLAMSVCRDGSVHAVTKPHTPLHEGERERVEKSGGHAVICTRPGGSCIKPKEIVDETVQPVFQPGYLGVSRCFGGMKSKMSFDPPFINAEPEVFTVEGCCCSNDGNKANGSDDGHGVIGMIVVSDGVYAYKGARLSIKKLEQLIKPVVQVMIARLQASADEEKRRSILKIAASEIKDTVLYAAEQAQHKIGEGDNIAVAVILSAFVV